MQCSFHFTLNAQLRHIQVKGRRTLSSILHVRRSMAASRERMVEEARLRMRVLEQSFQWVGRGECSAGWVTGWVGRRVGAWQAGLRGGTAACGGAGAELPVGLGWVAVGRWTCGHWAGQTWVRLGSSGPQREVLPGAEGVGQAHMCPCGVGLAGVRLRVLLTLRSPVPPGCLSAGTSSAMTWTGWVCQLSFAVLLCWSRLAARLPPAPANRLPALRASLP